MDKAGEAGGKKGWERGRGREGGLMYKAGEREREGGREGWGVYNDIW